MAGVRARRIAADVRRAAGALLRAAAGAREHATPRRRAATLASYQGTLCGIGNLTDGSTIVE